MPRSPSAWAARAPGSRGNSDGRSHGTVRLLDALAQSYNQATVRLGMDVQPQRLAELTRTLAGIESEGQPSLILGAVDQSPYAMAQLYQFLASGGEIQPLHAVRGVLDPQGTCDQALRQRRPAGAEGRCGRRAPGRRGPAVRGQLRHRPAAGARRPRPLAAAGKTGTSNDGRDSWFAGYTGDHLAVVWVGNDQNKQTGLYGATGGMRVWSDVFARLPSAPLKLLDEGLDWRWVEGGHSTDAGCPGARRFAFVAGYAPGYQACVYAPPPAVDEYGNPIPADGLDGEPGALERAGQAIRGWFGGDDPAKQVPVPADAPPAAPAPQP